jgi:hypothetical protein
MRCLELQHMVFVCLGHLLWKMDCRQALLAEGPRSSLECHPVCRYRAYRSGGHGCGLGPVKQPASATGQRYLSIRSAAGGVCALASASPETGRRMVHTLCLLWALLSQQADLWHALSVAAITQSAGGGGAWCCCL